MPRKPYTITPCQLGNAMNAMMCNGYAARVEFDADDRVFTSEVNAAVAIAANSCGKSLNQWGTEVLRRAVSKYPHQAV